MRRFRFRRRFLQFSIRALLVLMLAAAVFLAWLRHEKKIYADQRAALERITELGGEYKTEEKSPIWMRWLVGEDFLEVTEVKFHLWTHWEQAPEPIALDELALVRRLPSLKVLHLNRRWDIDDRALEHLRGLTQLEELAIESAAVSDEGVASLKSLPNLQSLSLRSTQASPAALQTLAQFPHLTRLTFGFDPGSVTEIVCRGFPRLVELSFGTWTYTEEEPDLRIIVEDLPSLQSVTMWTNANRDVTIRRLPKLTVCDLRYCGQSLVLEDLPALQRLEWGDRRDESSLLPQTSVRISGVPRLKYMTGYGSRIVALPASAPHSVESLWLERCEIGEVPPGRWERLLDLALDCPMPREQRRRFFQAPDLRSIRLSGLSDFAGEELRDARKVNLLALVWMDLCDDDFAFLASLPNLASLELWEVEGVHDSTLHQFERYPALKEFTFSAATLDESAISQLVKMSSGLKVILHFDSWHELPDASRAELEKAANIEVYVKQD